MPLSRFFLPLLLACSLLFIQQGSIAHTLSHTLAGQNQQDQQAPHTHHCELCALDAQLGSALNSDSVSFALALPPATAWTQSISSLHHVHTRSASARGPPASLQTFA